MRRTSHLQQFAFSRVRESREHLLVFLNGDLWRVGGVFEKSKNPPNPRTEQERGGGQTRLSVELVHNEMTERGFEEVLLGAVFQQRIVHRVGSNLETNL